LLPRRSPEMGGSVADDREGMADVLSKYLPTSPGNKQSSKRLLAWRK
jgi:hypothetical protein